MHAALFTEQDKQAIERAMLISNMAVLRAVIEQAALTRLPGGQVQYDTRPMLDPRENRPASLDWNAELLSYGEAVGLLVRDAHMRHLVRIARTGQG